MQCKPVIALPADDKWDIRDQIRRLSLHCHEARRIAAHCPFANLPEKKASRWGDFFSDFIAKSPDELTQRLCHALTSFMNDSEKVASQCSFRK
jgi:hypothetical protein